MKYFQEVTNWDAGYDVPNHTYYMRDDRAYAVGYIKANTNRLIKFSKPMRMEVRGRKFKLLDKVGESDTVYFPKVEEETSATVVKTVVGSNGKNYYIGGSTGKWHCSCPGFQFRLQCKHIAEMEK